MIYKEQPSGAALGYHVECFWTGTIRNAELHPVPPDGCVDIVYSRETGLRAVGTMTRTERFHLPPDSSMVGVRFRPGAAGSFLRVAPGELTDKLVPLEDVWGSRARLLRRQLEDLDDLNCQIGAVRAALEGARRNPPPLQRAIDHIAASRGDADLDWAARQANLSPRQFRRRCREEVGLAPKQLCRVLRFKRALAGMSAGRAWADLACECGYFDQAHLIRDFREFTGASPAAYREMTVSSNP